jgi:hypothetical protein
MDVVMAAVQAVIDVEVSLLETMTVMLKMRLAIQPLDRLHLQLRLCSESGLVSCGYEV